MNGMLSTTTQDERLTSKSPNNNELVDNGSSIGTRTPRDNSSSQHDIEAALSSSKHNVFRQLHKRIPALIKPKPLWPSPEASIGPFCGMQNGKYKVWEADGPAKETFEKLGPRIRTVLEESKFVVPSSSFVVFEIFMIGTSIQSCVPRIMFSCRDLKSRKTATEVVRKSHILDAYPGLSAGHWPYPPHIRGSQALAFGQSGKESEQAALQDSESVILTPIYSSSPRKNWGPNIIAFEAKAGKHMATAGCCTTIAGKRLFVTAAHPFTRLVSAAGLADFDEDLEVDLDISDDDDEKVEFEPSIVSGASLMTGGGLELSPDSHQDVSEVAQTDGVTRTLNTRRPGLHVDSIGPEMAQPTSRPQETYNAKLMFTSALLDYTLLCETGVLKMPPSWLELPDLSPGSVSPISPKETEVVLVTASHGMVRGTSLGCQSYILLPGNSDFQQTWRIMVDGGLRPGDSGSAVYDAETGKVLGILVAGSSDSGYGYMISATRILQSITTRQRQIQRLTEDEARKNEGLEGAATFINTRQREIPIPEPTIDDVVAPTQKQKAAFKPASQQMRTTVPDNTSHTPPTYARGVGATGGRRSSRNPSGESASTRQNEYFVPRDGIDREVITADIGRYLGNDALVRPGNYQDDSSGRSIQGYYITAFRNLTTAMITDLKNDSARWEQERRRHQAGAVRYKDSSIHRGPQATYNTNTEYPGHYQTYRPSYSSPSTDLVYPLSAQAPASMPAGYATLQPLPWSAGANYSAGAVGYDTAMSGYSMDSAAATDQSRPAQSDIPTSGSGYQQPAPRAQPMDSFFGRGGYPSAKSTALSDRLTSQAGEPTSSYGPVSDTQYNDQTTATNRSNGSDASREHEHNRADRSRGYRDRGDRDRGDRDRR